MMTPWMFILNPFERWEPLLTDYKRIFDLWEEGGVRGIVVGRLVFTSPDGTTMPTFPADPQIYAGFGVDPPPEAPRDREKEKCFYGLLSEAAARHWQIMIFDVRADGGSRPAEEDPYGAVRLAASAQDIINAYPQVHGIILDGPGEHPYELAFHRNREFLGIAPQWRQRFEHLDVDIERLERGIDHLRQRFRQLTPAQVRYWGSGGLMGALNLFDLNEDALYWLRTRRQVSHGWMAAVRQQFDRLDRPLQLGVIPRTAAFSGLTGQDYSHLAQHFDYVFPKHYFWHRGFDGLYGTLWRWAQQIGAWNPALTEEDCFTVVKAWLGLELPGVRSLADMESGFPDEFFSTIVHAETRRALEAVGDPNKVIAWISTGRLPHGGDMMTAQDLRSILTASQRAGLQRFVFHATHMLGASEWTALSAMCGKPWQDDGSITWPADDDRNIISFSGRPATRPVP
jgi:hypothetical protein